MKVEEFPAFKKRFERTAIGGFILLVISMAGCIAASKYNMSFLSGTLAFLFVTGSFFFFFHIRHLIHHVTCPKCNEKCTTLEDKNDKMWLAECSHCEITWRLGVGSKSDSNAAH